MSRRVRGGGASRYSPGVLAASSPKVAVRRDGAEQRQTQNAVGNTAAGRRAVLQRDISTVELMHSVSGPATAPPSKGGDVRLASVDETSFTATDFSGHHQANGKGSFVRRRVANPGSPPLGDSDRANVDDSRIAVSYLSQNVSAAGTNGAAMSLRDVPPQNTSKRDSAIHQASRDGKVEFLRSVLTHGGGGGGTDLTDSGGGSIRRLHDVINSLDVHSYAPLHHAARYGYVHIINLLLDHGAVVDVQGDESRTPLYLASKYNHASAVTVLLHRGADLLLADVYGLLPMHVAARRGHCQVVQCLLKEGEKCVNACDNNHMSPLHHSCVSGSVETTQLLLNQNVNLMLRNVNQETPFHLAALEGHENILKLFVDRVSAGDSISMEILMLTTDNEGNACVHLAALNGHTEVVGLCLETLDNINVQNSHGSTALHLASLNGHLDTVKLLCERGANIQMADNDLMTALHRATMFDRQDIVAYLLEKDKDLLQVRDKDGYTPVLVAAARGYYQLIGVFHSHQGSVREKDSREATCLHLAVQNGNMKCVKRLLELSGRELINEVDRDEASPLHFAAQSGSVMLCELLVNNGADLTVKDEHERLALHWAARNGHMDASTYLVAKAPTYVNASDDQGRTPLHLAAIHKHHHIVNMLAEAGADVAARDCGRWTALCHASRQGCEQSISHLLDHGAPLNMLDNYKNSALILASGAGHVAAVERLLSHGADLSHVNNNGMTSLDIAIHYEKAEVAMALLRHDRWHEIMDSREFDGNTPMKRLVEKMPKVAQFVLDRSVETTPAPEHKGGVKKVYDFRYVSEDPSEFEGLPLSISMEPFQAMEVMVENEREKLLAHPLSQALLQSKWDSFCKVLFVLNLLVYIAFLVALSVYALSTDLPNTQSAARTKNEAFDKERTARYHPVTQVTCNTVYGLVDFVYTSGHLLNTSLAYGIRPCNGTLFSHLVTCRSNRRGEDLTVFSPYANHSRACPSGNVSFLLACPVVSSTSASTATSTTMTGATSSLSYMAYEEGHVGQGSTCSHHAYNSTCQLNAQQLGVIYSDQPIGNSSELCDSPFELKNPPTQALVGQVFVIVFAVIHIIKELIYIITLRLDYFQPETILDWCVYSLSLVFVWPGLYGHQPNDIQWRCGAIALCVAWFNLLTYVQRFNEVGIYVVMFWSVIKTFIKVFLVYSIVLIAFALCFYILFSGHDNFTTVGTSILQMGVMMLGEVEFVQIFITDREKISYQGISYAAYIIYILLVAVVLMNLLIGLAVDDIEQIKKSAHFKRLAMQVHMISTIECRVPLWYRKRVYKRTLVVYPDEEKTKPQLLVSYMSVLINMSPAEDDKEDERESSEQQVSASLTSASHAHEQSKRMDQLENTVQQQNRLLQLLCEKLTQTQPQHSDSPASQESQEHADESPLLLPGI
eukprot:scpid19736/ scgid18665/ Transient receptor potential cation channel subfamily A member 1 homolog